MIFGAIPMTVTTAPANEQEGVDFLVPDAFLPFYPETSTATDTREDKTLRCRSRCDSDDDCDVLPIPRFLFAGQSNMVGYSRGANKTLFEDVVELVNEKFKEPIPHSSNKKSKRKKRIKKKLRKRIFSAKGSTLESSKYMAKLITKMAGNMKKKEASVLYKETILAPHPQNVCSFSRDHANVIIACEKPVSPTACGGGSGYGPELMFSHYLPKLETPYSDTPFGITKVAKGGTRIEQYLKSNDGFLWHSLENNIRVDNGTLEAFVWFQGENNHFGPDGVSTQEEYLAMLIELVGDVRQEIFNAHRDRWGEGGSPTAQFGNYTDVPVVICELGPWIGHGEMYEDEQPGPVILAQREYVADYDPNSVLVNTGTNENPKKRLSKFYHFDAPSILIIGHRIAEVSLTLDRIVFLEQRRRTTPLIDQLYATCLLMLTYSCSFCHCHSLSFLFGME